MFACLHALTPATSVLVEVARAFTPRFEVVGSLVMLDARGLSRIFGEPRELGRHLQAAVREVVPAARVAVASTQTTAALLALGRPGLTLVPAGQEAAMLAPLPLDVLGEYERLRIDAHMSTAGTASAVPTANLATRSAQREERIASASVGHFGETAPELARTSRASEGGNSEERTAKSEVPIARREPRAAGWRHPRDTHDAQITRRPKRPAARVRDEARIEDALQVLARWGVHTLGALSALPSGDLSERLGPRGVRWQRLARGEDARPLVPWVETPPYEAAQDLEWPIEGLEPLSFVLGRLLEPLTMRLERDDRGAAVLYTRLRLVSREAHTRVLQLPAPMRDAKALRTLMLLDLESHPPPAAIDQVAIALEPAPGRVVQEALFTRAVPPPEQVATLVARLTAVMGTGHVGTPSLVETWRPGAFTISADFKVQSARFEGRRPSGSGEADTARAGAIAALRRFRFPVPARVRVVEGRPVRVMSDRHGVSGGAVMECAGPWRASGDWFSIADCRLQIADPPGEDCRRRPEDFNHRRISNLQSAICNLQSNPLSYDRDEWDVAMADGTIYRIYVERPVGQWFIDGTID